MKPQRIKIFTLVQVLRHVQQIALMQWSLNMGIWTKCCHYVREHMRLSCKGKLHHVNGYWRCCG